MFYYNSLKTLRQRFAARRNNLEQEVITGIHLEIQRMKKNFFNGYKLLRNAPNLFFLVGGGGGGGVEQFLGS